MKLRFLVGAAIAAMLPFFGVAEIYTLAGADASTSPTASSSMSGTGTGAAGWTDSLGVTTKNHVPSAGNDYVVDQPYTLRTPTTTAFTFGGDSLTLTGGAEMKVKIGSGGTVTIPNLIVAGEARISHGDGNQIKKIAGAIDIREDGEAFFDLSFDNSGGNARQFEILSTISGSGILRAGASDPVKSGTPWIKFSGSLADFTGPIVIRANGSAKLETYFQSSLPGDPSEETADALSVEGENAVLKFMASGRLGETRGVSLGSGTREIYVDAGKTVQIDGRLTGTSGFKKKGAGTLVLTRISPELSGTVTVEEGTLQLCGIPSEVLPKVTTVSVSSGATLDENGPAYREDTRVKATLTGVEVAEDGGEYGPVLTVTDPAEGWQAVWSTDGVNYDSTRPTFTEVGEYTVFCHVSASGYMTRGLRTTVFIRTLRRVVATEADAEGDWAEATVAGDDASAAIQGLIDGCGFGDLVLVKAGTYKLTAPLTVKNKCLAFVGEGKDATVFDGQGASRCLVAVLDADAVGDLSFDGFTFTNGCAGADTADANYNARGGCVYVSCNQSARRITLSNCRVTGGRAMPRLTDAGKIPDKKFYRGAGAYAVNYCTFTGCVFDDNIASNSEAAAVGFESAGTAGVRGSGLLIADCVISNCQNVGASGSSGSFGAGVYDFGSKPTWIENTTFAKLTGGKYYNVLFVKNGSTITNCIFRDSDTAYSMIATGGSTSQLLDCRIERCSGTGIVDGNPVVERCVFRNNGVVWFRNGPSVARNCLFRESESALIWMHDSSNGRGTFENCTFAHNEGKGSSIVSLSGGSGTNRFAFLNCILWRNTAHVASSSKTPDTSLIVYTNCYLDAYTDKLPETHEGCIVGDDPKFVASGREDFRLREGSLALNAGLARAWMDGAVDLNGEPRIVGAAPDIGCCERQAEVVDPPYPFTRAVAKEEDKVGVWADASVGIPAALAAAYWDEPIYVKAGTYDFTEPLEVGKRNIRFVGEGPDATVLDGGYPARTNRIFTIDVDNVTLSGLTIRNGWMSGNNQNGGGVYVNATGFTITNCVFDSCGAYDGGGLYWANKTVGGVVLDCVFTNCVADHDGSGLYLAPARSVVRGTTFAGCAAVNNGACCINAADWVVVDSVFTNCTGNYGGGLRCNSSATGAITNTTFLTCGGKAGGQGLYSDARVTVSKCRFEDSRRLNNANVNGPLKTGTDSIVDNCYFSRNQGNKGTVAHLYTGTVMTDCVIEDQQKDVGEATDGVFTRGGGSGRYTVRNCLFRNVTGGKVVDTYGDLENCVFTNVYANNIFGNGQNRVRNCLFIGCTNTVRSGNCRFENCSFVTNVGGAFVTKSWSPTYTNCVFWGNTPNREGKCRGNSGIQIESDDKTPEARIKLANCVLQTLEEDDPDMSKYGDIRLADPTGATTNLTALVLRRGPKFVDPENGDWRLRRNSPLRDKGLVLDWMTDEAVDMDGKPRRIDTDGKAYPDSLPDIGCYECDIPKPGLMLQVR